MDEEEELKKELEQELHWVIYRHKMLDSIEEKLLHMKEPAEQTIVGKLSTEEIKNVNVKINSLVTQNNTLDEDSRKTQYKGIASSRHCSIL
jgi:hypothetical protein